MRMALVARVENGRIVVDGRTDLPEGTVLHLVLDDDGDDLDEEERARLHAALDEARAELDRGEGVPADDVIDRLEARHR